MWVRRYTLRETPDALLRRLQAAVCTDDRAEVMGRRARKSCLVGGVGLIILIFVSMFLLAAWPAGAPWIGRFLLLWLVGFTVATLFFFSLSAGRDLDDNKLGALIKLVGMLRADVPYDQPLLVEVDFRSYRKGRGRRVTGFWRSFFGGQRIYAYQHEWLRLEARFADGTALSLRASDSVKRKEKDKRKRPTRVGERMRGAIELHLRLGKQYGDAVDAASRIVARGNPQSLTRTAAEGRGRNLRVAFRTGVWRRQQTGSGTSPTPQDGETMLRALRSTYAALAPQP